VLTEGSLQKPTFSVNAGIDILLERQPTVSKQWQTKKPHNRNIPVEFTLHILSDMLHWLDVRD